MKNQKIKKQDKIKSGFNPINAAIAGAVVGAGIAIAGKALSNENNRDKIKKVVDSAKDSLDKTTKEVNKAIKSL